MKKLLLSILVLIGIFSWSCQKKDDGISVPTITPKAVVKTNTTQLYMHYMPWFNSKDFSGFWGIHWKMANKNPEILLPNGNRQIASHYYPLIGPYDCSDPDVIDYHLLLMKYSGIDGVLIDWYGSHDVLDYGTNLKNSNALIEGIKRVGLKYSIVYEEFTTEEVERRTSFSALEAAQKDMAYMEANYFSKDQYIKLGNNPLLLTFGPRYFKTPDQWAQILHVLGKPISFLPLWGHRYRVGDLNSSGEYAWVDFTSNLTDLNSFYQAAGNKLIIGSAYPGFHDFYAQGGWGSSYGFVDHQNGATLNATLKKAKDFNLPYLQLVTWNDFGEGTMIEPTQEFQYQYLETLQDFSGVAYKKATLEIIYKYYLKRKEHKGNIEKQAKLDEVFASLIQLDVTTAENLLSTL